MAIKKYLKKNWQSVSRENSLAKTFKFVLILAAASILIIVLIFFIDNWYESFKDHM